MWIKKNDIGKILISSSTKMINKLYHSVFIKNEEGLVSKSSIIEYIEDRIDDKYWTIGTARKKISLTSFDMKILKSFKNPKNPFFIVNIDGKEKAWIRKSTLRKIIDRPIDYRFISAKDLSIQLGLKSMIKITTSHEKGILKDGFMVNKTLIFPMLLSHEIKRGYIPPIYNHSIVKLRTLASKNKINYDLLIFNLKKGFFKYYFQDTKIKDGEVVPSSYYVYKEEFYSRLDEFNTKYNKKTWKMIKLINNVFKKKIIKRYILRINDKYYIRYLLKGVIWIDKGEFIDGEILVPIKKNPFPDEEQIFLSEIDKNKLRIVRRYNFTDTKYLSIKMAMTAKYNINSTLFEADNKNDINRLEVMLRNHDIFIGTNHKNRKESVIIGFEDDYRTMSITKGLSKTNMRITLKKKHLLPALMIHSRVKFRESKKIKISFNRNNGYLKAEIDNLIFMSYNFDPKPYGTDMKSLVENSISFLKKNKGRKIRLKKEFKNKIINAPVITEGTNKIITYKNISEPIIISFEGMKNNFKLLYEYLDYDNIKKDTKFIPYYIFEAIVKRKAMFSSLYEYSHLLLDKNNDIDLLIDHNKYTVIKANNIYKIYSIDTLMRPKDSKPKDMIPLYLDI